MTDRPSGAAPLAWGREFFAPLPLGAVALLALNDRVLKPAFGNAITGKLSDVAICFFLPLFVSALLAAAWRRRPRARLVAGAAVAACVFTAVELSDAAGAGLRALVAWIGRPLGIEGFRLTRDLTDLGALACVPAAVAYGWRRLEGEAASGAASVTRAGLAAARLAKAAAALATLFLLAATSSTEPRCARYAQPLAFRVDGGCGAPGVVVVWADGQHGAMRLWNAPALGFAAGELSSGAGRFGGPGGAGGSNASGRYEGSSCPFLYTREPWWVQEGPPPPAGRRCDATPLDEKQLVVACKGGPASSGDCQARLTLIEE